MIRENKARRIMLEMIIGTGRHGFHRVSQERVFYPTLIQRTAEDIIPEEFLNFQIPFSLTYSFSQMPQPIKAFVSTGLGMAPRK